MAIPNSKANGPAIIRRYDRAKADRSSFDARVDVAAPHFAPDRSNAQVPNQQQPGATLAGRTYDGEGIYAADLAVRFIGSELHGAGSKWHTLIEERDELNDEDEVREWLEESADRQRKDLAASNFYAEAYECDMDWLIFGSGSMLSEERPELSYFKQPGYRGTRFVVDKIGRFVIEENGWLEVDRMSREYRLNAFAARDRFGEENLPISIRAKIRNDDHTSLFTFIHAIYPREERDKTYGNKAFPFTSCFVERESQEVVSEGGYEEYPAVNPRWARVQGEAYGRGRADIALNDSLTLNAVVKSEVEGLSLAIRRPMLQRSDSVIGARVLKPWGVTIVKIPYGTDLNQAMAPLDMGSDFRMSQVKAEELRQKIRRALFVDELIQLTQQDLKDVNNYTWAKKKELMQKILGGGYGRWESEFGVPLISRHFKMLMRRGVFSPPPDILLERGGRIKVRFESSLARAQRQEEIQAMDFAMGQIAPLAELQWKEQQITGRPSAQPILDGYDFDKYRDLVNRNHGVSATVTRSQKEVFVLRKSRAEAEQQAKQAQDMMAMTEGAKNMAPVLKMAQESRAA